MILHPAGHGEFKFYRLKVLANGKTVTAEKMPNGIFYVYKDKKAIVPVVEQTYYPNEVEVLELASE